MFIVCPCQRRFIQVMNGRGDEWGTDSSGITTTNPPSISIIFGCFSRYQASYRRMKTSDVERIQDFESAWYAFLINNPGRVPQGKAGIWNHEIQRQMLSREQYKKQYKNGLGKAFGIPLWGNQLEILETNQKMSMTRIERWSMGSRRWNWIMWRHQTFIFHMWLRGNTFCMVYMRQLLDDGLSVVTHIWGKQDQQAIGHDLTSLRPLGWRR